MIREFWESQKEERKQKKLLKKQQKKQLTKEEKVRRITGYIVVCLIIVCMFATTCAGGDSEGINLSEAIGITEEYILEMEKPVDENLMFPNGKIDFEDWVSFATKLQSSGMNIFDEEYEIDKDLADDSSFTGELLISSRDVGGICKVYNEEIGINFIANVCDFEIYKIGDKFYEKSIIYLNLEKMIKDSKLPSIYLTSVSEVRMMAGKIVAMNYKITINQLSEELSGDILEVLNDLTNNRITKIANDTLNGYIYSFFTILQIDINLIDNGLNLSEMN